MLELCPEGFEEVELPTGVEFVAYVEVPREAAARRAFGEVAASDVEPGWEAAWQRFHRPVRVGPLWIGPPWEEPDEEALAVVIDPGRAFGTGAHATTRLCLELLLERPRTSLADLGCGSGVLAIAAAKLGFRPVTALDVDPVALQAAAANAAANGVTIELAAADLLDAPLPEAEVAVANLELAPVERLARRLSSRTLIASGYLASDTPVLGGWRLCERREAEGWAAERFERA
jgi:ribosomal protein L11 methyltransferase